MATEYVLTSNSKAKCVRRQRLKKKKKERKKEKQDVLHCVKPQMRFAKFSFISVGAVFVIVQFEHF